jgi:hypothetical protein
VWVRKRGIRGGRVEGSGGPKPEGRAKTNRKRPKENTETENIYLIYHKKEASWRWFLIWHNSPTFSEIPSPFFFCKL